VEMMRVGVVWMVLDWDEPSEPCVFCFGADGDDYSYILTRSTISFISYYTKTNA